MTKKKAIAMAAIYCSLIFFMISQPILADNSTSLPIVDKNILGIAQDVSKDVATVKEIHEGTNGAPIFILEENHASREGQIQNTIVLVRLHENYAMDDIALEGYLKEKPEIQTVWFANAAQKNLTSRARVAVCLLKEGEISEAEFMKLVYDDLKLHPIETSHERPDPVGEDDYATPLRYILKIAVYSLSEDQLDKLLPLVQEYQKASKENNTELAKEKYTEIFDFILKADRWTEDKIKTFMNINASTRQSEIKELSLLNEIVERAKSLSVELTPEEKSSMEKYIKFIQARMDASNTMVDSTEAIADKPNISSVAMVIGGAHTVDICSKLTKDGRPFIVLSPNSINNVDIPLDMFERKYTRESIYLTGNITEALLDAFPITQNMKPEPVLPEPWLQAKAELYVFTDRITTSILSAPSPGRPPYGFVDSDFRGNWIYINPNEIEVTGEGRAVLFPITLNPNNPARRTTIWIKAGLGSASISHTERESVEAMLKRALEEVKKEGELGKGLEDKQGRIQMTLNVVAGIAGTKSDAQKLKLESI